MFDCDCPCHTNLKMQHCDNLSCMPCCTTCQHCDRKIILGQMIKHLLEDHGVKSPKSERLHENSGIIKAIDDAIRSLNIKKEKTDG